MRFVAAILDPRRSAAFLHLFVPFQARVAELGIYNSLAQLAIKLTAPGVPDFYQGTEFWDLNLVDPDNRRPVDYDQRRQALAALNGCATDPAALLDHRHDGRVKMFVMARGLRARAECRDAYERGDYVPLTASGAKRDSVFAFARVAGERITITVVPRLLVSLMPDTVAPPIGSSVWGDTRVGLAGVAGHARRFREACTDAVVDAETIDGAPALPLAAVLERFPVAVLLPT